MYRANCSNLKLKDQINTHIKLKVKKKKMIFIKASKK